jgi:hypothetical protein
MGRFREDCEDDLYYLKSLVCDLNFPSPLDEHYKAFLGMANDSIKDFVVLNTEGNGRKDLLVALIAKCLMNGEDISINQTINLLKNQLADGEKGATYLSELITEDI